PSCAAGEQSGRPPDAIFIGAANLSPCCRDAASLMIFLVLACATSRIAFAFNHGPGPNSKRPIMTNTTMSARFAESDFRIGPVLKPSATILSQHFLIFFLIGVVANLPSVLLGQGGEALATSPTASGQSVILLITGVVLSFVLSMISQAVMVHASFQAMRKRPVNLGESLKV